MGYPDYESKGAPPCRTTSDPDIFSPDVKVLGSPLLVEEVTKRAKALCSTCPYLKECFQYAYENDEANIWGGTTQRERHQIKRRMEKAKRQRASSYA